MELSKKDKKTARIIIDKGIQKEYENSLSGAEAIVAEWRKGGVPNRDAYGNLYQHVKDCDKQIARRYDRMSGSDYLFIIAAQYSDGFITDEDLEPLSEQVRQALKVILRL